MATGKKNRRDNASKGPLGYAGRAPMKKARLMGHPPRPANGTLENQP